jgi:hypothetical protein
MPVIDYKAKREKYEDDNYVKQIDCPEHPGQHTAKLYEQGHRWAGQWECPNGFEDSCDHNPERENIEWEIEDVEVDDSHPDRSDGYTYQVYVCAGKDGCGLAIDLDVANPAEDAADAETDRQIDEARDNA